MSRVVCLGLALSLAFCLAPSVMAQDPEPIEAASVLTVVVPDTILYQTEIAKGKYWEPFTDTYADGTCVVIAGAHGIDGNGDPIGETQNATVFFISPDGTVSQYWAFYDDAGNPWTDNFNTKRVDGNPPRVCVDKRPGMPMRYVTGLEATPWEFPEGFGTTRWEEPYMWDERLGACQYFELTANGPQPITHVFGALYEGEDGGQNSGHMRFGGDMRFLSNGNFVIAPEDRTSSTVEGTATVFAVYDYNDGAKIVGPACGTASGAAKSIWSNVCAFDGGFLIRASGELTSFNNDGTIIGSIAQGDFSSVTDMGRGDDARVAADINHDIVCLDGKGAEGDVYLTVFNARTFEVYYDEMVNEEYWWDWDAPFNRCDSSIDENGNVICMWDIKMGGEGEDQVIRLFDKQPDGSYVPVFDTAYAFATHNSWANGDMGTVQKEGNVSMNNERIIVASNGIMLDDTGEYTSDQQNFCVIFENPLREPVKEWELY